MSTEIATAVREVNAAVPVAHLVGVLDYLFAGELIKLRHDGTAREVEKIEAALRDWKDVSKTPAARFVVDRSRPNEVRVRLMPSRFNERDRIHRHDEDVLALADPVVAEAIANEEYELDLVA